MTAAASLRRPERRAKARPAKRRRAPLPVEPPARDELDGLAARWQVALDAAQRALAAAGDQLPAPELGRRRRSLSQEREQTAALLARVAQEKAIGG